METRILRVKPHKYTQFMTNEYQEKSPIKCPNCGEEFNITIEEKNKIAQCDNCNYNETINTS